MSKPNLDKNRDIHFHGPAQGTIIGNYGTVIQHFVEGINSLPTDYSVRIENFITEYIGTPEHPVPFGGRDTSLNELNVWFNNPTAPPYLFLSAPAGRGKSALLTQWGSQVLELYKFNTAVVFIPVSIRFRTNLATVFFAALTARLAKLHGDEIPVANTSVEVWRSLLSDYLSRPLPNKTKLLIIIDGIDEAADWEIGADLFPFTPHDKLRVVVSARTRPSDKEGEQWLRDLGWDKHNLSLLMSLDPLSKKGVKKVLDRAALPIRDYNQQTELASELSRLSQGDPLLVRLYIDDLLAQKLESFEISVGNLRSIKPGLEGYFERWWSEQRKLWGDKYPLREAGVRTILNLLSCALGPLSRDNILEIAPEDSNIDSWTFDDALNPLTRLIIGDGEVQGYVFSHPQLAQYFYDRLSIRDREKWENIFILWGIQSLALLEKGNLQPKKVSPYLIQYFGSHLEREQAPVEKLILLINGYWRSAWESFEGGFSGFLNDVSRVEQTIKREYSNDENNIGKYIAEEVFCALSYSSVYNLTSNFPSSLIIRFVKDGFWTPAQGLAYARHTLPFGKTAEIIIGLLPHIPDNLLSIVLDITQKLSINSKCVDLLLALAPRLSVDQLTAISDFILKSERNAELGRCIIGLFSLKHEKNLRLPKQSNLISVLFEILDSIFDHEDEENQYSSLKILGGFLPESLLSKVCSTVLSFEKEYYLNTALETISLQLEKSGRSEEAITVARLIQDQEVYSKVLVQLIQQREEAVLMSLVTEVMNNALDYLLGNKAPLDNSTLSVEHELNTKKDSFDQYLEESTTERKRFSCFKALISIYPYLDERERKVITDFALVSVYDFKWDYCWEIIISLFQYLDEQKQEYFLNEASKIMESTIQQSWGDLEGAGKRRTEEMRKYVQGKGARSQIAVLMGLAPYLSMEKQKKVLDLVFDTINYLDGIYEASVEQEKLFLLIKVATISDEKNIKSIMDQVVQRIKSLPQREQGLVIETAAPHFQEHHFKQVLKIIENVNDQLSRNSTLEYIVPYLPANLLEVAENIVRRIDDVYEQFITLSSFAPYLNDSLKQDFLKKAQDLPDKLLSLKSQILLIPHLTNPPIKELLFSIETSIDLDWRAEYLKWISRHLTPDLIDYALEIARGIPLNRGRGLTLRAIAKIAPQEKKLSILRETLDSFYEYGTTLFIESILNQLPDEILIEYMQRLDAIDDKKDRTHMEQKLLLELASRNSYQMAEQYVLRENEIYEKAGFLTNLAICLPEMVPVDTHEKVINDAISACWSAKEQGYGGQDENLGKLCQKMSDELIQETIDRIAKIYKEHERKSFLIKVVPNVSKLMLIEIFQMASNMDNQEYKNEILASLFTRFLDLQEDDLAYEVAAEITNERILSQTLAKKAPDLPDELVPFAVESLYSLPIFEFKEKIQQLNDYLLNLPKLELYNFWRESLMRFVATRKYLFVTLSGMDSIIDKLGGSESVLNSVNAINKIDKWWR